MPWTLICMLALTAGLAAAQEPSGGRVVITHYGGPDFVIDNGSEVAYVDPLEPNAPNWKRHFKAFRTANEPVPDLVLITHSHKDHCSAPAIQQLVTLNPKLVVVAPVDARDSLEGILRADQLVTPVPEAGDPVVLRHGTFDLRIYRTLHGWYTDDASPYNLVYPFHHVYLVETKGRRILISGDSYGFYDDVAKNVSKVDVVLRQIYKPSDVFDFQMIQRLFSPSHIVPYHLNIRYGLQPEEMADLTRRYRFQDVHAVYLTEGDHSLVLGSRSEPEGASEPGAGGLEFALEIDRLFRGIQERNVVQVVAGVRNKDLPEFEGRVDVTVPDGWEVKAVDATSFARLSRGYDFMCRFRVRAPAATVLDGHHEYELAAELAAESGGHPPRISRKLPVGGGHLYAWNVIGPFDNAGGDGAAKKYDPEVEVDFRRIYRGRNNAPLRWISVESRDLQTGFIDMAGALDMRETLPNFSRWQEQIVAYALSYIDSPAEQDVLLHAGAPYGLHVFLNGQPLLEMRGYAFNFFPGQLTVPARLQKGRNTVLVKIVRSKLPDWNLSPWIGFCLRVTAPDGRPLPQLQFSLE